MAPTITGTNFFTEAEDRLMESLSRCPAFWAFTDTVHQEDAKARAYVNEVPGTSVDQDGWTNAEWAALFPLCIIRPPDDGGAIRVVQSAHGEYDCNLKFVLLFQRQFPENVTEQDAWRDFSNKIVPVLEEMHEQSNTDGRFAMTSWQMLDAPSVGHYDQRGPFGVVQSWAFEVSRDVSEK